MAGIENGIDRHATTSLLRSAKVSAEKKGYLRTILSGGVQSRHRLFKAHVVPDDACQFCETGEVEDEKHIWWRCPAWQHVRDMHPLAQQAFTPDWPQCLTCCA
eukprot:8964918-Karenia_brevis.AAC.1